MNKGLFALALGTFALGITEYLMMGILSNIATSQDTDLTDADKKKPRGRIAPGLHLIINLRDIL